MMSRQHYRWYNNYFIENVMNNGFKTDYYTKAFQEQWDDGRALKYV